MNYKLTLVLVVIALAMGAAVFWQRQQSASATPTPFQLPNQIFTDVRTGQVGRLEVRQGQNVAAAEKGDDNTWRWQPPGAAGGPSVELDAGRMDSLISSFVNVRSTRVLTDAAAVGGNLAQYGLDAPGIVVQAEGKEINPIQLSIGGEAPAGNARYALKAGSTNVYLISTSVVTDWLKLINDPPRAIPTPIVVPTTTPTPGS